MRAVWAANDGVSVRQVLDAVNALRASPLAYTTVMTVMNRLVGKGALKRSGTPRRYRYQATGGDEAAIAVGEVLRSFGDAAVSEFVDQARADPGLMRRLQALFEDAA
jgi:predicted transcriptional regulator